MATKTWIGTTADVTTGANWSPSGQPTAGDDVIITGTQSIDGATLSSAGNLASFVIRDYTGTIGSSTSDLVVDVAASGSVEISTSGTAYLDFNASDTDVTVYGTASASSGEYGLLLQGTSLNNIYQHAGSVRLTSGTLDANWYTYSASATARVDADAGLVDFVGISPAEIYGQATDIYTTGATVKYYNKASGLTVAQAEAGGEIEYFSDENIATANAWGGRINGAKNPHTLTVAATSVRDGGSITPGDNWTITANPSDRYQITSA